MNHWWQILEVAKNADTRTIKRAYSKKLKTKRPEDDPEAFQELHGAYKTGLAVAAGAYVYFDHERDEPDEPTSDAQTNESYDWTIDDELERSSEQVNLSEQDTEHLESLLEKVDDVLNYPLVVHNPDNWAFLTTDTRLLDDAFRDQLAREVIERIVEFENTPRRKGGNPIELSDAVITSLDSVLFFSASGFRWPESVDWPKQIHIMERIDGDPRSVEAVPLGGTINFKERTRPRHEMPDNGPENGFSPFNIIIVIIWLGFIVRCVH